MVAEAVAGTAAAVAGAAVVHGMAVGVVAAHAVAGGVAAVSALALGSGLALTPLMVITVTRLTAMLMRR